MISVLIPSRALMAELLRNFSAKTSVVVPPCPLPTQLSVVLGHWSSPSLRVSDRVTLKASPSSFFFRGRQDMPVNTSSLPCTSRHNAYSRKYVFPVRNKAKMARVDATPIAAEMIEHESAASTWDRTHQPREKNAVRALGLTIVKQKTVPVTDRALPVPAAILADSNLSEDPLQRLHVQAVDCEHISSYYGIRFTVNA